MPTLTRPRFVRRAAALVLAAAAAGGACSREADPSPETGTGVAVTVQPARLEVLRDAVAAPGTIVPAASGDLTVTAIEPGEIAEMPKAEGDAVEVGDLLVRFEIPSITNDINNRQIEVSTAAARVEAARKEAARQADLHEKGLTARIAMESARAAAIDAESALTQVQALLDAAKAQEHRTIVRARFAGIVTQIWHAPGTYVATPGEPVLRMIDPNRVQVLMRVPLADFQRVISGQPATVQPPGGPAVPATVVLRVPPPDALATTAEVRLDVGAPGTLRIDTPVMVDILIEERRDVLTVAASAVLRDGSAPYLWTVGEDGRAHRREVRVGLISGGRAQILSGIEAGERVILTGLAELNEGIPVRVS